MEGVGWREELLRQAEKIMVRGGELNFKVIPRGRERIPEIRCYPENYVRCRTETLT